MALETKSNPIAQFGPIAAPILGGVLLVVFAAVAYFSGDIGGETATLNNKIRAINTERDRTTAKKPIDSMPSVSAVLDRLSADDRPAYVPPAGQAATTNLPVQVIVRIEAPIENEFDEVDADKNGYWDDREFRASRYYEPKPRTKMGAFENWDRDGNKQISREEYADPPIEDSERFNQLDKNDPKGFLTAPDEISREDLLAWDENFDDRVDLQEFIGRYYPKEFVDLGAPTDVEVAADPEKMEIVVSWKTPALAKVPDDVTWLIERYSPETLDARNKAHGKVLEKYAAALEAWEKDFEKWWNGPAASDATKKEKDLEPNLGKAKKKFEAIKAKPVEPPKPSVWDVAGVATGNDFRDVGFDTDVTYTYAVRMLTGKKLKRGQVADTTYGDKLASARASQAGHPVRVRNLLAMSWSGAAGANEASVVLSKWFRYGDGAESVWYRIQCREKIDNTVNPNLGGEYTATQLLKDHEGKAFKVGDNATPADLATVVGAAKIDFRTSYRFVTNTGAGTLLTSTERGDFELPKDTRAPQPAQAAPTTATLMEVRVLALTSKAAEATVEVTRWFQSNNEWFRIVSTRKVKKGEEAGMVVSFAANNDGVEVFDSSGSKIGAAKIKALVGGSADLTVGKYDGLDGRNVKIGSDTVDLFGALFK